MKNFLRIVALILCLGVPALAQQSGLQNFTTSAVATQTSVSLAQTGINYHKLQWTTSGTVSTCTVSLDTSPDNSTWTVGGAIGGQTCTSAGSSAIFLATANFVRINVSTISGGGSITATWLGYTAPNGNITQLFGTDIRTYNAALNGTGVSGGGTDDSAALKSCLGASTGLNPCLIPALNGGQTTHLRIATPIDIPGTANVTYYLHCAGANTSGFSGSGQVSIDVDLPNGLAGPAIFFGDPNDAPFEGVVIDRGCMFRDISPTINGGTSRTSPGAVGMMNWSNDYLDFSATGFSLPPMGAASVTQQAGIASCSLTGGFIKSTDTIFSKLQALGPGWGPAPATAELSAATSTMGCSSGTTCSCTPLAPTGIASGVTAVEVFWGISTGAEAQVGLPYVCTSGSCPMTQLLNFANPATSASAVTCIPGGNEGSCGTGIAGLNTPDTFDHSGGYALYGQGVKGWGGFSGGTCQINGGQCTANQFINQLHLTGNDFDGNTVGFDFDNTVAAAMINGCHVNLNFKGHVAIQTESGILVQGCHFEGGIPSSAANLSVNTSNAASGGCAANCATATVGNFNTNWDGPITIAGAPFYIKQVNDSTHMTLTTAPGTQTGVALVYTNGPMAKITGNTPSQFVNDFFESGSAITAVGGVGMVKSQFVIACGNSLLFCFQDDAASSNNQGLFLNFIGALSYQQSDDIVSTTNAGARTRTLLNTKTVSSVTPSAFTGFSWGIEPNQNYTFTCDGLSQAAATGGLQFTVTGPASPTKVTYSYNEGTTISSGAVTYNWVGATGTTYPTSVGVAITTATTDMPVHFVVQILNGATGGSVVIKANSAAAVNTLIEQGFSCTMTND